jgi:GxxExxY protein
MRDSLRIADLIRQAAYEIHIFLGHGYLEKIYENALVHRLRKLGLAVQQQCPIEVRDEDGTLLGTYAMDLIVENEIIVELKTVRSLAPEHQAQVLGYLKATRIQHALLINFGSYRFEIRKFAAP